MKVKFITLGCKVNQYETQALKEKFLFEGHEVTQGFADVCIINTCTVTSRADSKSREMILRAKKENPDTKIAVTGCMTQLNYEALKCLNVDFVIPQGDKASLVDVILNRPVTARDPWDLKVSSFSNTRAFIKIQDGCDNRCSFCKVPLVRGNSRSRPFDDVLEEAKRVSMIHKEIVLCGINICLYGKDFRPKTTLAKLAREIIAIPQVTRIRFSSLEPCLIDEEIIDLFKNPKVCPHAHIPFQSGDDAILKIMNKKETVKRYITITDQIRNVNPLSAISCDIIIGIPGEDEKSFLRTEEFLNRINPMRTHIFTFSPRQHTVLGNAKPCDVRDTKRRSRQLKTLTANFALSYGREFLNRKAHMVTEEYDSRYTLGYTEHYLRVSLKEKVPLGEMLPVRIESVGKGRIMASRII